MQSWTDPPRRSELVTIASGDHTFTIKTIYALHNPTASAGAVVATLWGDTSARTFYILAGGVQYGMFKSITASGTGPATILGLTPMAADS